MLIRQTFGIYFDFTLFPPLSVRITLNPYRFSSISLPLKLSGRDALLHRLLPAWNLEL